MKNPTKLDNTLLLIDGSALLVASYYGNLPESIKHLYGKEEEKNFYHEIAQTEDGIYTNALYSFLNRLDDLIKDHEPEYIAVTFDVSRTATFRAKQYPEYKGQRKPAPEPLMQQKDTIQQILRDIGIPVFSYPLYEGDDLIGSLANQFKEKCQVVIYANDRDMTQLVGGNVRMWYTATSGERAKQMYETYTGGNHKTEYEDLPIPYGTFVFNEKTTERLLGIKPEHVPDWKGLGGDTSDNIPGVRGISEETAAKILSHFDTIEDVFAWIENTPEKEAETTWKEEWGLRKASLTALKKEGAKESAFLSKDLATIKTDIIMPIALESLRTHLNEEVELEYREDLNMIRLDDYEQDDRDIA